MDEHINVMPKISNREKILAEGLKVVHERGFGAASVRDIVQAAGVPQGSFTNHFASKEAFGLEVIDRYFVVGQAIMRETLLNEAIPPLDRLRAYFAAGEDGAQEDTMRNGCLFGNFAIEANDNSDAIRRRLVAIFDAVEQNVATCLRAAVNAGQLPEDLACDDVAGFIVSSMQGAKLLAKARRSPEAVRRVERMLFSSVLRQPV